MMNGRGEDLRARTKEFALRISRLCSTLAKTGPVDVISRQVVRSGTSVGAQYREACRSRPIAEFVSKMESAAQELDETMYWMELLSDSGFVRVEKLAALQSEANERMAIFVASARTAKKNRRS